MVVAASCEPGDAPASTRELRDAIQGSLSARDLRDAIGYFATGVTVVTSLDADHRPIGTTVSAVTSLSVEPPLVLACLSRRSATLQAVRDRRTFAVNVLAAGQHDLCRNFARSGAGAMWDGVVHERSESGNPLLSGVLVALDCTVEGLCEGGDHEIVIGRVHRVHRVHAGDEAVGALLHWRGAYAELVSA
jgi:3-hydroxy-9,10-secoandrosta-1,3,5(10)-triene-9,17-dione monooxygenase reductase component